MSALITTDAQRDLRATLQDRPRHVRRGTYDLLRDGHDPFMAVVVPDMVDMALSEIMAVNGVVPNEGCDT